MTSTTCKNVCLFGSDQDITDAATDQWHDHLRSYVHAGGGLFEHMLWHECSFIWFTRTCYEIRLHFM